jgi:outer membrane protein assembly factor BamE
MKVVSVFGRKGSMRQLMFLISLSGVLFLGGCKNLPVYQPSVEQGNFLEDKVIARLHRGMTRAQVKDLLGNPVLQTESSQNHLRYVYTLESSRGKTVHQAIFLTFEQNRLIKIEQSKQP